MTDTQIGHYRITAPLGKGGMGEVFRARDLILGREVAVKILLGPYAADPDRRSRFQREAQAASALSHPNIATIYEAGVDNGIVYIAMELIDGERFRDLMTGPLPAPRVLELGGQVAAGLAKAHEAGIVHRDLKPENLMLSHDGFVKILDFGLARFTPAGGEDESTLAMTQPGVVMGTLPYMSPEQVCGREIDARSDQFSLGTILYEMATGLHPFRRASAAETMAAVVHCVPDPLPSSMPSPLAAVIGRCLEKDFARRYESTRQLAEELKIRPPQRARWRRWPLVAALCAATALAITVKWPLKKESGRQEARRFVAVLPFRGISADPSQAHIVDGITQEIRDQLSRISALRLLSAGASGRYRGGDSKRLASETGVGSVVEGAVRMQQGRVHVSASLIDARTEETLWSDQFDSGATDPFAVEREVARRIASALGTQITGNKRERPTDNLEAYDLYLRALNVNRTGGGTVAAMNLLRQAIQLDPGFAEAMAELSIRNVDRVFGAGLGETAEAIRLARQAITLDPQLPRAHFALGTNYAMLGRVASARAAYERALELDPNCAHCMNDLADLNFYGGQFESALRWARRALLLAPNTTNGYYHVAGALYYFGDAELTNRFLSLYHDKFPRNLSFEYRFALLLEEGRSREAVTQAVNSARARPGILQWETVAAETAYLAGAPEAERLIEPIFRRAPEPLYGQWALVPESPRTRYACLLIKRGARAMALPVLAAAEKAIRQMLAEGADTSMAHEELAAIYALRGEKEAALAEYERAYTAGWRFLTQTRLNPALASLRGEPKFEALVQRMQADLAVMRTDSKELVELRDRTIPYLRSLPTGSPH